MPDDEFELEETRPEESERELPAEPIESPRSGDPVEDGDSAPPAGPIPEPEVEAPDVSSAELQDILDKVEQPEWVGAEEEASRAFEGERWPEDIELSDEFVADEPRRPQLDALGEVPEAGTGIAIHKDTIIGRIPSRVYPLCREWLEDTTNGVAIDTPTPMELFHGDAGGAVTGAIGVPSPVFGKVTGLVVNTKGLGAGVAKFAPYNVTTASAADAPEVTGLTDDTGTYAWDDGLAVSPDDKLILRYEISVQQSVVLWTAATFIIEEQSAYVVTGTLVPDATGVYVRNGQYGGKPAFERIDGAFWLWWHVPGNVWLITVLLGNLGVGRWGLVTPSPIGAYAAVAPYTGTATVAAHPD